jgi:hypothetical protein
MPAHPEYAIVGNGRWAGVMHGILSEQSLKHSKVTIVQETRRREHENDSEYQARMSASMAATAAKVAWICVPPSPNTLLLAAAAVNNGMHVIAEKPWIWTESASQAILAQGNARGVVVGVHYEYCLLDAVESWRSRERGGAGLQFRGRFMTSAPDRLRVPALENLGSHLFAIRAYAAPEAEISRIDCGYDQPDERMVSLTQGDRSISAIDFSANREPIIQRFIARFERALDGGPFPFTLDFALEVLGTLNAFRAKT